MMQVTIYDGSDEYGQMRYLLKYIDESAHGRVMFMTDHFSKAVDHYSKFKDLAGERGVANWSDLEVSLGNTKIAFRAVRSNEDKEDYKDHYRYAGSEWSSLYLDKDASFTTEAFTYLITRVRLVQQYKEELT